MIERDRAIRVLEGDQRLVETTLGDGLRGPRLTDQREVIYRWAQRFKRVFNIDMPQGKALTPGDRYRGFFVQALFRVLGECYPAASVFMQVLDGVHHLLHQMQAQTACFTVLRQGVDVYRRRLGDDVEGCRFVVGHSHGYPVFHRAQFDSDVFFLRGIVFHHIREQLINRQVDGKAQRGVNSLALEKRLDEIKYLRQ